MITKFDTTNAEIARQIYTIFQNPYKIEAQLIGALDFPPLLRSAKDIQRSATQFYGFSEDDCLAVVIEIAIEGERLEINSLTVDPSYFRKGIANKLISYILETIDFIEAVVKTAVANIHAVNLYKKYGVVELKKWTPSHGIETLAMSVEYAVAHRGATS
jgi:ribosomal protein S18 acetylase RimI-like enzyme